MINSIAYVIILLCFVSCQSPISVSWDPYLTNEGISLKEIKQQGWETEIIDGGMCSYRKQQGNKELYFNLHFQDDCTIIRSQELYITLPTFKGINYTEGDIIYDLTPETTHYLDSILATYNSQRISPITTPEQSCRYSFQGQNHQGTIIEWSISICEEFLMLSSYAKLGID